jgi:CRISPR-associated protein Cas2
MFIVVAYDIPDDRCRTRLHETLRRFGEPVQYSVFECILDSPQFVEMRGAVAKVVEGFEHNVRYYRLCEACRRAIITVGNAFTTELKPAYIV